MKANNNYKINVAFDSLDIRDIQFSQVIIKNKLKKKKKKRIFCRAKDTCETISNMSSVNV